MPYPVAAVRGKILQVSTGPSGLLTNLISYWTLDEASGTRVDSVVASGNDLTDNNTVTQAAGKVGNAGQFVEANLEYLSRADNALLSTGDIDFTFAGWFYLDAIPTAAGNDILGKFATNEIEHAVELYRAAGQDHFRFFVSSNGTGATGDLDNIETMATATWHFFVVWHDSVANTINSQLNNGTVRSAAYSAGVQDGTAAFNIGRAVTTRYFNGRIDEVPFWKRVLTATERTNLYNSGNGVTYPFTGVP